MHGIGRHRVSGIVSGVSRGQAVRRACLCLASVLVPLATLWAAMPPVPRQVQAQSETCPVPAVSIPLDYTHYPPDAIGGVFGSTKIVEPVNEIPTVQYGGKTLVLTYNLYGLFVPNDADTSPETNALFVEPMIGNTVLERFAVTGEYLGTRTVYYTVPEPALRDVLRFRVSLNENPPISENEFRASYRVTTSSLPWRRSFAPPTSSSPAATAVPTSPALRPIGRSPSPMPTRLSGPAMYRSRSHPTQT
jgi:hypothetical protein